MHIKCNMIVLLASKQNKILEVIHNRLQGITKCWDPEKFSVWWSGINRNTIKSLNMHSVWRKQSKTEESPTLLSEQRFQMFGTCLCEAKDRFYLILMNYFSRYLEIPWLPNINKAGIIGNLKNIFAWQGIPLILLVTYSLCQPT